VGSDIFQPNKKQIIVFIPVCEVSTNFTTVAYIESMQLVQPVRDRLLKADTVSAPFAGLLGSFVPPTFVIYTVYTFKDKLFVPLNTGVDI